MESELSYLVSNVDIEKKFKNKSLLKIVLYSDLNDMSDLSEILPHAGTCCFILLRTSENSGHWTVIVRSNEDKIYYFDSYGVAPDGEMSKISPELRYELHENKKKLSELLKNHGVEYNRIQFQKYDPEINTCGKWTTVFAISVLNGLSLQEFQHEIIDMKHSSGESYDEIVCELWKNI